MKRQINWCLFLTFIMMFLYIFLNINIVFATDNNLIYIDPGHGGFDGGATSNDLKTVEKDIVLEASLYLQSYLEKTGYKVNLTRYKDEALAKTKKKDIYKRVDLINKSNCLLYISMHANAYPASSINGAQVFYNSNNSLNEKLASKITKYIQLYDLTNRRVEKEITGKYLVDNIHHTGCLVELGFLTNEIDLFKLTNKDTLKELTFSIYLGILEFLEEYNS